MDFERLHEFADQIDNGVEPDKGTVGRAMITDEDFNGNLDAAIEMAKDYADEEDEVPRIVGVVGWDSNKRETDVVLVKAVDEDAGMDHDARRLLFHALGAKMAVDMPHFFPSAIFDIAPFSMTKMPKDKNGKLTGKKIYANVIGVTGRTIDGRTNLAIIPYKEHDDHIDLATPEIYRHDGEEDSIEPQQDYLVGFFNGLGSKKSQELYRKSVKKDSHTGCGHADCQEINRTGRKITWDDLHKHTNELAMKMFPNNAEAREAFTKTTLEGLYRMGLDKINDMYHGYKKGKA